MRDSHRSKNPSDERREENDAGRCTFHSENAGQHSKGATRGRNHEISKGWEKESACLGDGRAGRSSGGLREVPRGGFGEGFGWELVQKREDCKRRPYRKIHGVKGGGHGLYTFTRLQKRNEQRKLRLNQTGIDRNGKSLTAWCKLREDNRSDIRPKEPVPKKKSRPCAHLQGGPGEDGDGKRDCGWATQYRRQVGVEEPSALTTGQIHRLKSTEDKERGCLLGSEDCGDSMSGATGGEGF